MVLHLLLVQHAACEHGEMVEVSGAHRAARTGGDRETTAARTDGSTTASDAPADRPGHDHCDALAVRHQLPEAAPAVAAASLVWIALDTGGGDRAEQRAVPILSLAPKGSPPAA